MIECYVWYCGVFVYEGVNGELVILMVGSVEGDLGVVFGVNIEVIVCIKIIFGMFSLFNVVLSVYSMGVDDEGIENFLVVIVMVKSIIGWLRLMYFVLE